MREFATEEMLQNLIVGSVAKGDGVELVHLHELIENIGTQHHSAGYRDGDAVKVVAYRVLLYY